MNYAHNCYSGWAGILHAGKLDEAALALETIERNASLQMQLIEDLLDISHIMGEDISLNVHQMVVPVITAAIEAVQPAADTKAIQLGLWSKGWSNLGGRTACNLVKESTSNAIKFTPVGGRVEVRLDHFRLLSSHSGERYGQGISADFLPYFIDRFRQADSTSEGA